MNIDDYLKDFTGEQKVDWWKQHDTQEKFYTDFMEQYKLDHECCPDCGKSDQYWKTLVGYIFNPDAPESYKDLNDCNCACGSRHEYHDRVPNNYRNV